MATRATAPPSSFATKSDGELRPWATRLRDWHAHGIDSYSYFNNDPVWQGRPAAITNARRLREMVG